MFQSMAAYKRKVRWLGVGFSITLLFACAGKPTVHLYTKYLSPESVSHLQSQFESEGIDIKTNHLDTPVDIAENTVLYSLMLKDAAVLDRTINISGQNGFDVNLVQPMVKGNHWYTKDSLALILFPEKKDNTAHLFHQDLVHQYQVSNCSSPLTLQLRADFSYVISGKNWTEEEKPLVTGNWLYRQYPYIELRKYDAVHSHMYFEISRTSKVDQISELRMQTLTPLEPYEIIAGCSFEVGERISG